MIGPDIPEHLRKHFSEAAEQPDDDASSQQESETVMGPQIPAGVRLKHDEPEEPAPEDDDPDAYAPALPPELLAARKQASVVKENAPRRRAPVGPTLPPGFGEPQGMRMEPEQEDWVIGPVLPKNFGSEEDNLSYTIAEIEERARRARQELEGPDQDTATSGIIEREEWMLVPPEAKFLGGADPMNSRSFSKKNVDPAKIDSSGWTETPADREKRLREGKSSQKRKQEVDDEEPIKYSKADLETRERVERHNAEHRAKSLVDMHKSSYIKSRVWEQEDASKRGFDRERDVVGSRRMDGKKKKEIIDNSRELGTKFGHGRGGSFLRGAGVLEGWRR
ncbi:hypothetical protein BC936DRAFT_148378 [Jimgerdemannia flammicorona]|uniref:DUF3752 domain-containing protein n=1 Tax=Jimgerdemannia flammicorona TaxID=994334 RepID=A0A433D345_9FUNG|nr:hypothetical protein BC936DRAFT_148378 [Jimgerdemannia flammicorona]